MPSFRSPSEISSLPSKLMAEMLGRSRTTNRQVDACHSLFEVDLDIVEEAESHSSPYVLRQRLGLEGLSTLPRT